MIISKPNERMLSLGSMKHLYFNHSYVANALQRIADFHRISMHSASSDFMLLYGQSGSGKTTLVKKYCDTFNSQVLDEEVIGVLLVSVPSSCTPKALAEAILSAIGDLMAHRGTLPNMSLRAAKYIQHKKVSLVILDEFQHFMSRRNQQVVYEAADWLKSLANSVECPFLAVGLPLTVEVMAKNEQLERRVVASVEMPAFPFATKQDRQIFKELLASFAERLPFENQEFLVSDRIAGVIHQQTQGLIGRVVRFLRLAGETAVRAGEERLQACHFELAASELRALSD